MSDQKAETNLEKIIARAEAIREDLDEYESHNISRKVEYLKNTVVKLAEALKDECWCADNNGNPIDPCGCCRALEEVARDL